MPPRPKIPAHVAFYAIASVPGVGYAMYWYKNRSTDEEFEDMLRKNYGSKIETSRHKKESMVEIIGGIKSRDPTQESKLQEVLRGGKSEAKRQHAVDEVLYGTEEGVAQRETAAAEEEKKRKKQKKKKKKKKKQRMLLEEQKEGSVEGKKRKSIDSREDTVQIGATRATAAVVVLGSLALVTSLLIGGDSGGKRSQ